MESRHFRRIRYIRFLPVPSFARIVIRARLRIGVPMIVDGIIVIHVVYIGQNIMLRVPLTPMKLLPGNSPISHVKFVRRVNMPDDARNTVESFCVMLALIIGNGIMLFDR
jgi:hypothetical protein